MLVHFNIDTDDLRETCCRNGFYTRGSNLAYCNMFDIARQGTGIETVEAVARDIIEHSADEYELTDVMETIINTATYISVEEQEEGRKNDGKRSSRKA